MRYLASAIGLLVFLFYWSCTSCARFNPTLPEPECATFPETYTELGHEGYLIDCSSNGVEGPTCCAYGFVPDMRKQELCFHAVCQDKICGPLYYYKTVCPVGQPVPTKDASW